MNRTKTAITDEEERDLIESSERGEWVSVGNIEERRTLWQDVAKAEQIRQALTVDEQARH